MTKKFTFALFFLISGLMFAQNVSISPMYQLSKNGEYYGISVSKQVYSFNHEKVIWQLTGSVFTGSHWGEKSNLSNFYRAEVGFESKNTMILGRDFFNIINLSYAFTKYQINTPNDRTDLSENGLKASFGLGARINSSLSFTTRYVWGFQNGIRIGFEYGL